ncbi:MAG: hypothetical protein JXJ17_06685 [Anaerolineae bacterium]|nr:hypothetical protein [Anaerolineae bacterium]
MQNADNRKLNWLWMTLPIVILTAAAALIELFVKGTLRDAPNVVAQGVAQDIATLAVALPVLVISAILAARGSLRARLVWLGGLVYIVYTYMFYAFAVEFNALFLVYMAILGCSFYTLVGGLLTTDREAAFEKFGSGRFVRPVAVLFWIMAALFSMLWLKEDVPALLSGTVPESVTASNMMTNPVHVLDYAFLIPALVMSGVWLRRGRPAGVLIAPPVMVFSVILGAAIIAMWIGERLAGFDPALPMLIVFSAIVVVNLAGLIGLLGGKKEDKILRPGDKSPG